MTRRQWMWLWIWLLLFFIIFCVWNKLQALANDNKVAEQSIVKTVPVPATKEPIQKITQTDKVKDISLKIVKDKKLVKISGVFASKEALNNLESKYQKVSTNVKKGMIIIDEDAKNSKIIALVSNLAKDFSNFKSGSLEYSNKKLMISGVVDDKKILQNINDIISKIDGVDVENSVVLKQTKQEQSKEIQKDNKPKTTSIKTAQAKIDNLLKLKKVEFIYGKDVLRKRSKKIIDQVYNILKEHKNIKIEIGGHTDSDGSLKNNQILSKKRANAIKHYLIAKGNINSSRLKTVGYGEGKPLVKNDSIKNKQINRRVEFKVIGE